MPDYHSAYLKLARGIDGILQKFDTLDCPQAAELLRRVQEDSLRILRDTDEEKEE